MPIISVDDEGSFFFFFLLMSEGTNVMKNIKGQNQRWYIAEI